MRITKTVAFLAAIGCAFPALPQPNVLGRAFPLTNARYGQRSGPLFAPASQADIVPSAHLVLFGSADQKIELMTSSDDGVFVVWFEVRDVVKTYHVGVRSPRGDWKEIQLPDGAIPIAAAAGGGQFIIVVPRNDGELAVLRWTAALEPIGGEIPIGKGIVTYGNGFSIVAGWIGSGFAIIGPGAFYSADIAAMLLSPSGALSAPKLIHDHTTMHQSYTFKNVSFAFHGDTFVLAWKANQEGGCFPEDCDFLLNPQARALRVSADLSAVEPIEVASYQRKVESVGGVAWDGSAFVVAWKDRTSLYTRRIPPTGAIEPEASVLSNATPQEVNGVSMSDSGAVVPVPGGIAMLWKQNEVLQQSIIRSNAVTAATTSFDNPPQRIASLGSAVAYASSSSQNAEPHYGATRVMMTIGDVTLPELPEAPRLTAMLALDGHAVLTWTAPRQKTNGYRIEQRGSDGDWLEVERWLSAADARFVSIPITGATSFRIRAWNDAGVSAYSNVASPALPPRRAARH